MQIADNQQLTNEVIEIIAKYVPKNSAISMNSYIGRELGITGWDSIDLLEEIEGRYGVDLRPFMESVSYFLKPRLVDKMLGRPRGPVEADATVEQLIAGLRDLISAKN
jgi:hypothetical protein